MKQSIGILGSGVVGQALAAGFLKHGYDVCIGTRSPEKLANWNKKEGAGVRVGSFSDAAKHGPLVVLAVKGHSARNIVENLSATLAGKVVMDATNPIAEAPPVNGVLRFTTSLDRSLMEQLQETVPAARFVKVFNSVGSAFMVNPDFGGVTPTMFICGNDDAAKNDVTAILTKFGWEAADVGRVESARAIEPLCILWCLPGLLRNEWTHAFKLLKK